MAVRNDQAKNVVYVVLDNYNGYENFVVGAVTYTDGNFWSADRLGAHFETPIHWFSFRFYG